MELPGVDLRLGSLEGTAGDAFGLIADVEEGTDGSVYVLDSRLQQLKRFSAEGTLLSETGRGGRGPGEYYAPMRLQITKTGEVLLLDAGNLRLNVYDPDLNLLEDIRLPSHFMDFCFLDERIFLHGLFNDFLIHEFDKEKRSVRSFARAPAPPDDLPPSLRAIVQQTISRGRILCDPDGGAVILVAESTPRIAVYHASGQLLWEAEIPEYRQVRFVAGSLGGRQGIQFALDPETNSQHILGSVGLAPGKRLLVQLGVVDLQSHEIDDGAIHSWFLDLTSRKFLPRVEDLPRLFEAGRDRAYFVANIPYPLLVRVEGTVLNDT